MRNQYAELFKEMNEQSWKELRDKYTDLDDFRVYINKDISNSTLRYYDKKFNYIPIPKLYRKELGHKYGHLTVIEYAGTNTSRNICWKCRCDCGNEVIRDGTELRRSRTKDHMCEECNKKSKSQRFWKDLTGQTINDLFIIERSGTRPTSGNVIYKCKCLNCGNILNISSDALSHQISCGCLLSRGEYIINRILNELSIEYKTQYKFEDCKYITYLKFDFAILKNNQIKCLIEFQGSQHYNVSNGNWNDSEEQFITRQERDEIKREYCKQHKIPLIEIPYTDINKLNQDYLLSLIKDYI